jgi:general secretion pathway protein K
VTQVRRAARDQGFGLVVAVAAVAAFACIAFEVLAANRGSLAGANAQFETARLQQDADAGIALALHGLAILDPGRRWAIDGRPKIVIFDGVELTITVEDEKGKAPINRMDGGQVRALFAAAGVTGVRLDQLVDSFEDWTDTDDTPRPHGAESSDPGYRALGVRPRNGELRTLDEMIYLKGMDAVLLARIEPALTVFFGSRGGFDESFAQPLALAAMNDEPPGSVMSPVAQSAGTIVDEKGLPGRPLTIRVLARDDHGGRLRRAMIVELTGKADQPYWVRLLE